MFFAFDEALSRVRYDLAETELARLDSDIAAMTAELTRVNQVDAIYQAYEVDGLSQVAERLDAKRAQLDIDFPADAPHAIVYLNTHPNSGGHDVTAWEIRAAGPPPPPDPPVRYSHTVAWDADALILRGEGQEDTFHRLRYNLPGLEGYSSAAARRESLLDAIDRANAYRALVVARNTAWDS